jgi:hypothetical protein
MSNALCQIIQAQMAAGEKVEGLDKELEVARVRKNTALKAIGPMRE